MHLQEKGCEMGWIMTIILVVGMLSLIGGIARGMSGSYDSPVPLLFAGILLVAIAACYWHSAVWYFACHFGEIRMF